MTSQKEQSRWEGGIRTMINKFLKKVKSLTSSGKNILKKIYKYNKKSICKFLGKTFIIIIKIIVEKLLDKWM